VAPTPGAWNDVWKQPPRFGHTDVGWAWKVVPGLVGLAVGVVTDRALSDGHREANPLLRWAERRTGGVTSLKLLSGTIVAAVVHRAATHHANPRAAKVFSAAVTLWNAADLAIDLERTR
jgi:hypothetical protein